MSKHVLQLDYNREAYLNMKKRGFTIAEVMITLAIIGVIAALIIPTFISGYRKQVYANTLSKAVSDFEMAMSAMMIKDGADNLFGTRAWRDLAGEPLNSETEEEAVRLYVTNFGRTMGLLYEPEQKTVADFYSGLSVSDLDGSVLDFEEELIFASAVPLRNKHEVVYFINIENSVSDVIGLSENTVLNAGTNLAQVAAVIIIDINGRNAPNILGRDIFHFVLGADGRLYPEGCRDLAVYMNEGSDEFYEDVATRCVTNREGAACAAYLMNNKYRMDY